MRKQKPDGADVAEVCAMPDQSNAVRVRVICGQSGCHELEDQISASLGKLAKHLVQLLVAHRQRLRSESYPRNIPAIAAEIRLAMVPASIARTPNCARSLRRSGTSAPMPPICIPIEPRFANPHSAKVAIVNDRGASAARCVPSEMY